MIRLLLHETKAAVMRFITAPDRHASAAHFRMALGALREVGNRLDAIDKRQGEPQPTLVTLLVVGTYENGTRYAAGTSLLLRPGQGRRELSWSPCAPTVALDVSVLADLSRVNVRTITAGNRIIGEGPYGVAASLDPSERLTVIVGWGE